MNNTKIQENEQIFNNSEENLEGNFTSKLASRVISSFKLVFFPKSRIERLQVSSMQYQDRKKKSINNRWLKSTFTFFGVIVIFIIITIAIFGHWIAPYSYEEAMGISLNFWNPPSPVNPLGTGFAGRDVLSRVIYGTRTALVTALLSVSISLVFGIFLGMLAGYYGKWVDSIIMRVVDIILAFPGLIFALAFLAILGSQFSFIVLIFGVIGIPYYSRLIRSSVFKEKELDYIAAAKVSGANNWRIMFKHILPNSIQSVLISMSFDIGRVMINLTILGFLGFNDPEFIDWGSDIFSGRRRIWEAPWASFWPSVMISICVIGFMIVGDGLRDALDPKFHQTIR